MCNCVAVSSSIVNAAGNRGPRQLVLLSECKQPIGLGKVCDDQEKIHGHQIPYGHIKVILEYIKPQTRPPVPMAFDDEELQCGQFCVWPIRCTNSATYT